MEVKGKLVLITGASRGIGAATAKLMHEKGAKLILVARSEPELKALSDEMGKNGGETHWRSVDLSDLKALEKFAADVLENIGVPDILINNAGLGRWLFTEETPAEEAEMMTRLPYQAAFHLCRLFLPAMLKRKSGHIVNVNSPASVMPWGGATAYAASRWALRGFSESLKIDLRNTGVGISHIILGEVESSYWDANPGARARLPKIASLIPKTSTEKAGKYILKAIRTEKKEMTRPAMLWIFRRLLWLTPWLTKWLIATSSYKRK